MQMTAEHGYVELFRMISISLSLGSMLLAIRLAFRLGLLLLLRRLTMD
jgi:hypothetical protein